MARRDWRIALPWLLSAFGLIATLFFAGVTVLAAASAGMFGPWDPPNGITGYGVGAFLTIASIYGGWLIGSDWVKTPVDE